MRPSTGILAALVIVTAACHLTAAKTVGDAGVVAVSKCSIGFSHCKPKSCTEDGKCIFSNPLCSIGCRRCECTLYDSYDNSHTECPAESKNCSVRGCRQDGSCVMESWDCQQKCDCTCAITPAAWSELTCSSADGNDCYVIGCTPDNKCILNLSKCNSVCEACNCEPEEP